MTHRFVGCLRPVRAVLVAVISAAAAASPVFASDHADTPVLIGAGRHDARISDLFALMRGEKLVLIVCSNPTISAQTFVYDFPTDVTFKIAIDNNSAVTFDNADDLGKYGGTIVNPAGILEDIVIDVRFNGASEPLLQTSGLAPGAEARIGVFAGLRDDPFIRGPLIGRNIAALVLELPLADVLGPQDTLLIWATSAVDGMTGDFQEMGGRALRSQLAENLNMNALHPSQHVDHLGVPADVIIYDTSRPAAFPNGRELADDVVDLVGDPRLLNNDAPFPDSNDKPFEDDFPYLAQAHLPPGIPTVSTWGIIILSLAFLILSHVYFGRRPAAQAGD